MKTQTFIPLLVIAAGLLAYHNSFTGPFVFDDAPSIQENPTIRHLWPIWQPLSPPHRGWPTVEGRPLVNLSLAINYAFGGTKVRGYHALNLTIHILAGLTLLGVVRRTLLQPRLRERFGTAADGLAVAVAVIWTVHPLQTESVTYIVQRAESMMGLLYLLTLYWFIRAAESPRPRAWYGLCVSACALGMASKEVMASAPLMVMLYDRTFVSGSLREAWRRRWPLYVALASTWILLGYLVLFTGTLGNAVTNARSGGVAWWEYLLTEPGVTLHYLRLSVWPHPLVFDYGPILPNAAVEVSSPALIIALLLLATGASLWRWPAVGFLGVWFFAILAPSSSVVPLPGQAMAEHRMYLPLAAVVMLGVMGIHAVVGRRTLAVVVVLAVGLGVLTWRRNQDYRSEFVMWDDTVAKWPQNPRAHNNLGETLMRSGRMPEAIEHLERALRIKPDYAEAHNNLGLALEQTGKVPEAIEHLEQALRIKPDYAEAHCNLAIALEQTGKMQEAIDQYEQALRIKPDFAAAHYNLGAALEQAGRLQDAMGHYEQALRIKPDFAEAHYNLGLALARLGQQREAIGHWEQALRIMPDYAEAHNNMATALFGLGKQQEAILHFERALQIAPVSAPTHYNLGVALERMGQVGGAIEQYEQALKLRPDLTAARDALARLRAAQ